MRGQGDLTAQHTVPENGAAEDVHIWRSIATTVSVQFDAQSRRVIRGEGQQERLDKESLRRLSRGG